MGHRSRRRLAGISSARQIRLLIAYRGRERADLPDFPGRLRVLRFEKIPTELQVQPELCGNPEEALEPQCGVGRDAALPVDDLVDAGIRDADRLSELRLRHA